MNRDFRKLWAGQTISQIGSRVSREGLPYTAVALLGVSTAEMGVLSAVQGFMALLLGPVAGMMADRYRHRPIMIGTDLGRAAVLATVPWAAATGRLSYEWLFAVAVAAGVLTLFFDVAYQAHVPVLVRREELLGANAKLMASNATAEMVGPGLTGFLIQMLGAPRAILLDAVSFVLSAVSIAWIRKPQPVHTGAAPPELT